MHPCLRPTQQMHVCLRVEVDEGERGLMDVSEKVEFSLKTNWTWNSSDFLEIGPTVSGVVNDCTAPPLPTQTDHEVQCPLWLQGRTDRTSTSGCTKRSPELNHSALPQVGKS